MYDWELIYKLMGRSWTDPDRMRCAPGAKVSDGEPALWNADMEYWLQAPTAMLRSDYYASNGEAKASVSGEINRK